MVGAGSAEFGVVSADELVVARSQGNDVVALFAVFQNNPQGIMVHASRKLASLADLFKAGGTVALQRGLPYARLLEKKYGFDKVKIVPSPGGDISAFLADKNFAQQCFIMSEPLTARHQGADVQVFPVSDAGYNPYTTVLTTSGDFLRQRSGSHQSHGSGGSRRMARLSGRPETHQPAHESTESVDGAGGVRGSGRGAEAVHRNRARRGATAWAA